MTVLLLILASAALIGIVLILLSNLLAFPGLGDSNASGIVASVSVLVPARNEAAVIGPTVRCLSQQSYPYLELLILDDSSEDCTVRAALEASGNDNRLRVLRGRPIPGGWLAKNWACHQLAGEASEEILIFADADLHWHPRAVAALICELSRSGADMLAIMPSQKTVSWAERLCVPLMAFAIHAYLPAVTVHRTRYPLLAAANGQCIAFRRSAYIRLGGHASVRDSILDDIGLAQASQESRPDFAHGRGARAHYLSHVSRLAYCARRLCEEYSRRVRGRRRPDCRHSVPLGCVPGPVGTTRVWLHGCSRSLASFLGAASRLRRRLRARFDGLAHGATRRRRATAADFGTTFDRNRCPVIVVALAIRRASVERAPRSTIGSIGARQCLGTDCEVPHLDGTVLHVWTWRLDVDQESLSRFEVVLSTDEWRRVRRSARHLPARRFIVRRGMLRFVLGQYLDQLPQEVRFVYNPQGKPALAPQHSTDLHFNLSDSGDLAVLGVGKGGPLGIDIERLRPIPLVGRRVSHDLPPREVDHFDRLGETEASLVFLRAWTCREAIAKAEGVGLQLLSSKLNPDDFADLNVCDSDEAGGRRERGYYLHDLTLPEGYIGFLATRQKLLEIRYCSPDRL